MPETNGKIGRLSNPVVRAERNPPPEYPTDYKGCARIWKTRRRKLARNTYLIASPDSALNRPPFCIPAASSWYGIRLHETVIVRFHRGGTIVLDSGGWQTVTTKERMNRALPSGYSVGSERGVWYLYRPGPNGYTDWKNRVPFADGITIGPRGGITKAGIDPKRTQKLRKRINGFATDYVAALFAGKVPAPGPGDCFFCSMPEKCYIGTLKNGKLETRQGVTNDHIVMHIREKYYVPSLLARAIDAHLEMLSPVARHDLGHLWGYHNAGPWPGGFDRVSKDQTRKCLRKYLFQCFGLPF